MLSVQINGTIAYLHYFPAEKHPGYQSRDMTPDGCPADVHFLQPDGGEADSFDMPDYTLVAVDAAYVAAVEFFHSPALPILPFASHQRGGVAVTVVAAGKV